MHDVRSKSPPWDIRHSQNPVHGLPDSTTPPLPPGLDIDRCINMLHYCYGPAKCWLGGGSGLEVQCEKVKDAGLLPEGCNV